MQIIIDHTGTSKSVDKNSIALDANACQSMELLCTLVPDNSIIVEEGAIGENWDEGKDQHIVEIINKLGLYYQFQDINLERVIFNNSNGRANKLLKNVMCYNIILPVYVVSACSNYRNHNKIVFFPEEELMANLKTALPISSPTHNFSCLNSNQWSHRILTYLHLYEKTYFKDIIFSWGRRTEWTKDFLQQEDFINDIVITEAEWKQLASMPQRILTHSDDDTDHNDRGTDHPAYTDACVNIITETTSRNATPQLTEKSFKPVLAGQFFIMIGSMGLIEYMRDLGIDVFDDVVDHSYDSVLDDRQRIAAAIKEIDRLNELELWKLHAQCKDRFIKNQQWLTGTEFRLQFPPLEFK